jgi:hypothetical protein
MFRSIGGLGMSTKKSVNGQTDRVYGRRHGMKAEYDDPGTPAGGDWVRKEPTDDRYVSSAYPDVILRRKENGRLAIYESTQKRKKDGKVKKKPVDPAQLDAAADSFLGTSATRKGCVEGAVIYQIPLTIPPGLVPTEDVRCSPLEQDLDVVRGYDVELRAQVSRRGDKVRGVASSCWGEQATKTGSTQIRIHPDDLRRIPLQADAHLTEALVRRLYDYVDQLNAKGYGLGTDRRYDLPVVGTSEVVNGKRIVKVDPTKVRRVP